MKKIIAVIFLLHLFSVAYLIGYSNSVKPHVQLVNEPSDGVLDASRRWLFELRPPASWKSHECSIVVFRTVTGVKTASPQILQTNNLPTSLQRVSVPLGNAASKCEVAIQLLRVTKLGDMDSKFQISGEMRVGNVTEKFEQLIEATDSELPDESVVTTFTGNQETLPLLSLHFQEGNEYVSYTISVERSRLTQSS